MPQEVAYRGDWEANLLFRSTHAAGVAMFDEVLLIGAFGRLVGLMPSALRFYDDCGLLQPASVDPATGYRLYRLEQERRAVLLRDLRGLGLPLPGVRAVLDGDPQDAVRAIKGARAAAGRPARSCPPYRSSLLAALTDDGDGWRVQLSGPELSSPIRQVAPAAAVIPDVPALMCVLLETDGDEVCLVASDRHQLAVRVLPARSGPATRRAVLVPATALTELAAWVLRHDVVTISGGSTQLRVSAADELRELPNVDAVFPDYRALLDRLAPRRARAWSATAASPRRSSHRRSRAWRRLRGTGSSGRRRPAPRPGSGVAAVDISGA